MAEIGFPPPDDPKSLKARLLSSTAPLPERVHPNPFAEAEAPPPPEPSNENELARAGAEPDFKAYARRLIDEAQTTGRAPTEEEIAQKMRDAGITNEQSEALKQASAGLEKAKQELADAQKAERASFEAREVAREKLRNVDLIRENARRAMSGEPPLTDEEWERIKHESGEEGSTDTDVHAENVGRFRSFMRGAVAQLSEIGHGVTQDVRAVGVGALHPITSAKELYRGARTNAEKAAAYAAYFAERGRGMDEKLAKLKVDSIKLIENYNALPAHRKLELTVALATASGVASGFSATISGLLAGAMYGQRAFAGLGFARNRYTGVEKKIAQDAHWLFDENSPTWKKVIYAGALGAAYSGATATAAYGLKDFIAYELYGTTPVPEHGGAAAPHAPAPEVPKPAEVGAAEQAAGHGAAPAADATHEAANIAAPAAPEFVPVSVEAHAGDGGIKLFKHLQEAITKTPGFDPNHLTPVQEHILHGDPTKLAEEYGFYKPNEALESARVLTGSSLGFDAHGDLIFTQHGAAETLAQNHGYEGAFMHAGHHAGVAPEHAQLHEVRARLGITEEQQTAELNRMSLEAHQAVDHPAPAPVGPEAAPSAEFAPSAPHAHEVAAAPTAEHAPPAHLEVKANHLAVDTGGAHQYLAHGGVKVVFGGSSEERAARAAAWVARDHQAVVYFDRETKDLFGLRTHHHLMRMTWRSLSGNEIGPLGEQAAPLAVEQPYLEEVLSTGGKIAHVPSLDDLQTQVPDAP